MDKSYCMWPEEIMNLFMLQTEDTPVSFAEVGDEVTVFNGERVLSMVVDVVERREYTLVDHLGYRYLAAPWVKSPHHGLVFKTKNSMNSKLANGWMKHHEASQNPASQCCGKVVFNRNLCLTEVKPL